MSTVRCNRSIATAMLAAGLALLTATAMAQPALPAAASTSVPPSPARWLSVPLETHAFGHLRTPDAIAATAGPTQVGFSSPPEGQDGVANGPWSFDVAQDGSIWLLDEVNHRLLVWRPGRASGPARTVAAPDPRVIADFAVARDGTIYVTYFDINRRVPGMDYNMSLAALSPTGEVRWRGPTIIEVFNGQLRFGPDGALYWPGLDGNWTQLTTPAGRLLTIAEQRQRTLPGQPMSGGRRLVTTKISDHEWRVVLLNQAGQAVRGSRITSQTELWTMEPTLALIGADPVIVLDAVQQTTGKLLWESLVLRLGPTGGARVRFAIPPTGRVIWGDTPTTGLRFGADGHLYQLRTDPAWGVRIARWSLQPAKPTPPPTTIKPGAGGLAPSTVAPPTAGPTVPTPTVTAPALTAPTTLPVQPRPTTPSVHSQPLWHSLLPWLAVAGAVAVTAAVELWLWRRRHHRQHPARPGRPRPAH